MPRSGEAGELRRQKMLKDLGIYGYQPIAWFSKRYGVTSMTVHRDLNQLQERGRIKRTFGGAIIPKQPIYEIDVHNRENIASDEKKIIGQTAATQVDDGDIIFIDGGTTTLQLARMIGHLRDLVVVTNNLLAAAELSAYPQNKVILCGGKVMQSTLTVIGDIAVETLEKFSINKTFLGAGGVNIQKGLTHSTLEEAPLKKAAAKIAETVYLLVDHTKFGKDKLSLFMGFEKIDAVITDRAPKTVIKALKNKNVEIILPLR